MPIKLQVCCSELLILILLTFSSGLMSPAQAQNVAKDVDTCFVKSGDEAIAACNRVIASNKSTRDQVAAAYINRGQEWYAKKEYDQAIADFDQAISIDPNRPLAYGNRANAYDQKGDSRRAITDYDKALAVDPAYTAAYTGRGKQYEKLGAIEKARADYNAALAMPQKYQDGKWAHDYARERLSALK